MILIKLVFIKMKYTYAFGICILQLLHTFLTSRSSLLLQFLIRIDNDVCSMYLLLYAC